jgi:hypothetical protein
MTPGRSAQPNLVPAAIAPRPGRRTASMSAGRNTTVRSVVAGTFAEITVACSCRKHSWLSSRPPLPLCCF